MSRTLLIALALLLTVPLVAQPDRRTVTGFLTVDSPNPSTAFFLTRCNYTVDCRPLAYDWPKDAMVSAGSVWSDPQTSKWLWEHRGKRVRVTWEVLP